MCAYGFLTCLLSHFILMIPVQRVKELGVSFRGPLVDSYKVKESC